MHPLAPVAVTATTEIIRGALRLRVNAAYTQALRGAGLLPLVLPVLEPSDADAALEGVAGLVLTGGEDVDPARYGAAPHPALGDVHEGRDAFEIALVHAARARGLPTLAICRGVQILNVALGGSLVQDIATEWTNPIVHDGDWARTARVHEVEVTPGSRLAHALPTASWRVSNGRPTTGGWSASSGIRRSCGPATSPGTGVCSAPSPRRFGAVWRSAESPPAGLG